MFTKYLVNADITWNYLVVYCAIFEFKNCIDIIESNPDIFEPIWTSLTDNYFLLSFLIVGPIMCNVTCMEKRSCIARLFGLFYIKKLD